MKVNGKAFPLKDNMTVALLLKELQYSHPNLIIAINDEVLERIDFDKRLLREKDSVQIIHPIVGG
ncbi:sulfur carrier protein ThiS [Alkaliphilus transvaalensis]|uniref:sulfur carrier protein ThiS n=1 Tax=Alkaliphilus transvaalensis TaxID=114628 RepID=UPI00047E9AB7|nr:sulfur carrier protein ThiS [Alkaliphilus transvaalensis]